MQTPDGELRPFLLKELVEAKAEADKLKMSTGKPHPIFVVGEEVMIKGGMFKVHKLLRNRMVLKPIKY